MLLRAGDTVDFAGYWLDGVETETQRDDITRSLMEVKPRREQELEVIFGPTTFHELTPSETMWPVPSHINGPAPKLLIARAQVVSRRSRVLSLFVADLEPKDHALLRRITRRVRKRLYPREGELTDRQCDTIINDLGPDAALETLKALKRSDLN